MSSPNRLSRVKYFRCARRHDSRVRSSSPLSRRTRRQPRRTGSVSDQARRLLIPWVHCPKCRSTAVKARPERTAQLSPAPMRGLHEAVRSGGLLNRTNYPSDVIALVVLWGSDKLPCLPWFPGPRRSPSPCDILKLVFLNFRLAGQFAGREVRLDSVERFLEGFLVRDLARHKETRSVLHIGGVTQVDEPFIDNLGSCFRRNVRPHVGRRLGPGIDICGCPRDAGLSSR